MSGPLLFSIGTVLLAAISYKSLLRPRSHGFFRFFAWEAILGLVILNAPAWFEEPFGWHQIISWILLTVSILPLVFGVIGLRAGGQEREDNPREAELFRFERTTKLVQDGIFRLIRHPMYTSLLVLAWGLFFKSPSIWGLALAVAAAILLTLMAKRDEAECLRSFGAEYENYMRRTKMFIPYLV